jgi:hypothetical protein
VTEVIYDFVFTPPQAQIELQCSDLTEHWSSFVYCAVRALSK